MLKSLQSQYLDRLRDRKARATIAATLGLFLFIFLAYRACLANANARHRTRTVPSHNSGRQSEGPTSELCATFADLRPHEAIVGDSPIRVSAPIGMLQGVEKAMFGTRVSAFLGVPYAEPPLRELR